MITIDHIGSDLFDRGERTVFYRDSSICNGAEMFYCWLEHWHLPTDGLYGDFIPVEFLEITANLSDVDPVIRRERQSDFVRSMAMTNQPTSEKERHELA